MAKNKNTFEKRRKEIKRMQKAQEKRERRFARRRSTVGSQSPDGPLIERDSDSVKDQSMSAPSTQSAASLFSSSFVERNDEGAE